MRVERERERESTDLSDRSWFRVPEYRGIVPGCARHHDTIRSCLLHQPGHVTFISEGDKELPGLPGLPRLPAHCPVMSPLFLRGTKSYQGYQGYQDYQPTAQSCHLYSRGGLC